MEISILQKQGRTPLTVLGMDTKWLLCPFLISRKELASRIHSLYNECMGFPFKLFDFHGIVK
jgi:hypothetical protein